MPTEPSQQSPLVQTFLLRPLAPLLWGQGTQNTALLIKMCMSEVAFR